MKLLQYIHFELIVYLVLYYDLRLYKTIFKYNLTIIDKYGGV